MQPNLLKAEMVRQGLNGQRLSAAIGISESAFYRKLNGVSEFTQGEIKAIADTLGLGKDTVFQIFFEAEVS